MNHDNILKIRLAFSTLLALLCFYIEKNYLLSYTALLSIYLIPYIIISYDIILKAFRQVSSGKIFSISFLMTIATISALFIGLFPNIENEFIEAIFVIIFYQIGEMLEEMGEGKSKDAIKHLIDLSPELCHIEKGGKEVEVKLSEAQRGDIAIIRAGEKIGFDATVIEGESSLNTMALTGESLPKEVKVGDKILAGCINMTAVLKVKVDRIAQESTVAKILSLVKKASENKSESEKFIHKFARYYTPFVVFSALILAFICPLFSSNSYNQEFPIWLQRALSFLVASCPCALVISIPLSFFGGIGAASKKGILVKGSSFLEKVAKLHSIVFDKTGTLTQGQFTLSEIHNFDKYSKEEILHLAAHAESLSNHPIANSISSAHPIKDECKVTKVLELAGRGIQATINQDVISIGNKSYMQNLNILTRECGNDKGTLLHVAINNEYAGHIIVADNLKEDAIECIDGLKKLNVKDIHLLSGDNIKTSKDIAQKLNIENYSGELLPEDKLNKLEELKHKVGEKEYIAFVGDGINDAPVITKADIGIAMGGLGSDAAIEAADIVIMDDKPSKLISLIHIARKSVKIAKQNIAFSISFKLLVLVLATLGYAPMYLAVFADVGVMIIAILNSLRSIYIK